MVCCVSCALWAVIAAGIVYLLNRWYRRDFISDFYDKYVFITGTDSGFGSKLAVDLDSLGVHVYAGCYTKEGADDLKSKTTDRLKTFLLDVTDKSSVEQAKVFIENDLPAGKLLWGVVNNAGILGNMSFELSTVEDYRQVMEVNYFGSIRVAEVFSPLIKKSRGRIVQLASMFGRGCMSTAPYTSSKHAIEPYTDELRRYIRKFGVKVATIEPGFMNMTSLMNEDLFAGYFKRKYDALPAARKAELGPNYVENEIKFYRTSFEKFPLAQYNDISMVTEAITHALGAKHPKTRYLVGYDARPYVLLTVYTPDWFLDGFIRFSFWRMKTFSGK